MSSIGQHIHFAKKLENGELVKPDRAVRNTPKGFYQCADSQCRRPVFNVHLSLVGINTTKFSKSKIQPDLTQS
jgi:hypothetical protein